MENRLVDMVGGGWEERGEGRRGWEEWRQQHGNVYTTMYKIDSGNLLYDTRRSTQYSVITERGGVGWEVGGRRQGKLVYPWLIHVDVLQKPTKDCKAIILPLKKKKKETQGAQFGAVWWPRGGWWEVGRRLKGEGTWVHLWLIHVIYPEPAKHYKAITL